MDSFIKSLLSGAVQNKGEHGDLLPAIVARRCCEVYDGLDLKGKSIFLKILSSEFGKTTHLFCLLIG